MLRFLQVLAIVLAAIAPGSTFGHEARPGYLELRQTGAETYDVLWKVPARGDMRLSIHPRFPKDCRPAAEPVTFQADDAYTERASIICKAGLAGRTIVIDGLAATMTDVLVRSVHSDGSVGIARVTPSAPLFAFEAAPGALQVARTYSALGISHILLGIDHLLFVLALLILVQGWRRLFVTITAFTIAHSITLAAATLGLLRIPQTPVEVVIALSIVYVAVETIRMREGRDTLAQRQPWVVAFCFGLLHGLGFAGALRDIGLPEQSIPLALLFFNIGVEAGQLLFIAAALGTLHAFRHRLQKWPAWAWRVPVYAIGTAASYWMIERVVGFWV